MNRPWEGGKVAKVIRGKTATSHHLRPSQIRTQPRRNAHVHITHVIPAIFVYDTDIPILNGLFTPSYLRNLVCTLPTPPSQWTCTTKSQVYTDIIPQYIQIYPTFASDLIPSNKQNHHNHRNLQLWKMLEIWYGQPAIHTQLLTIAWSESSLSTCPSVACVEYWETDGTVPGSWMALDSMDVSWHGATHKSSILC